MKFCPCGRPALDYGVNKERCQKHQLSNLKKKERQYKFSGTSKYREEMGQFQAIRGR